MRGPKSFIGLISVDKEVFHVTHAIVAVMSNGTSTITIEGGWRTKRQCRARAGTRQQRHVVFFPGDNVLKHFQIVVATVTAMLRHVSEFERIRFDSSIRANLY